MVIEEGGWSGIRQSIVSVKCKDYRKKRFPVDEKMLVQEAK